MIDAAGNITLVRARPDEVWHVLMRIDGTSVVTACGVVSDALIDRHPVRVDDLLSAGRICLDCAAALIGGR